MATQELEEYDLAQMFIWRLIYFFPLKKEAWQQMKLLI